MRAWSKVVHEYVTHAGLRTALGKVQFNALMDLVWKEHGEEITESSLAQRYGYDANGEMPENARLSKQRELAEEFLAQKAEAMATELRAGIESAEVSKWRKFLAKIRKALEKFLPREKLNELDDRTLTDLLRKSLANAGYQIDVDNGNVGNIGNVDGRVTGRADFGDVFRTQRKLLPPEQGTTSLFTKKME